MRRLALAALLLLVVAAAAAPGAFAAAAPSSAGLQPAARLAEAGWHPELQPAAAVLPAGVRIAGVDVGGLQTDSAETFVRAAFAQPLVVVLAGKRISVAPADLGAVPYAGQAVRRALASSTGATVDLSVKVPGAGVRAFVASLAAGYDRPVRNRTIAMVDFRPTLTKGVWGREVDRAAAVAAISGALSAGSRTVRIPTVAVRPTVPPVAQTALIVVRRSSNQLELYHGVTLVRKFGVATGQSAYPTPLGTFQVVTKVRDPWWYPPASPWAQGEQPVPPGPGNPLGTRWMGLSAPLVGIHGTPDAASIGYSRSHGCVRMRIDQAEWLFDHVDVGTKVMIVPA